MRSLDAMIQILRMPDIEAAMSILVELATTVSKAPNPSIFILSTQQASFVEKVTKIVTILAVAMGIVFFFLGTYIGKLSMATAFIFAIGIIVANVPEGLLPTVSLSLNMAVQGGK